LEGGETISGGGGGKGWDGEDPNQDYLRDKGGKFIRSFKGTGLKGGRREVPVSRK